jgi:hypothetical protein
VRSHQHEMRRLPKKLIVFESVYADMLYGDLDQKTCFVTRIKAPSHKKKPKVRRKLLDAFNSALDNK